MEPKPKAKQNARRKGCGKAAPWKSPNNGLFHLAWKSANPADFHFPTAPAATVIYLLFERLETKNKTRPRQRLTYPKQKMALTMGSTLEPESWRLLTVERHGAVCNLNSLQEAWVDTWSVIF